MFRLNSSSFIKPDLKVTVPTNKFYPFKKSIIFHFESLKFVGTASSKTTHILYTLKNYTT